MDICNHDYPENSCREDIVKLWLNHSYNELFKQDFKLVAEHDYKTIFDQSIESIHKKKKAAYWKVTTRLSHYTIHDIERNRIKWQLSTKSVYKREKCFLS